MTVMHVRPSTTITVPNHQNLLVAWRLYGHTGLVGRFVCRTPLTAAQSRRLPAELRGLLK